MCPGAGVDTGTRVHRFALFVRQESCTGMLLRACLLLHGRIGNLASCHWDDHRRLTGQQSQKKQLVNCRCGNQSGVYAARVGTSMKKREARNKENRHVLLA